MREQHSKGGVLMVSKNRLHRVQVVAIGGHETMCFGSDFGVAAVFAPTLAMFSKTSNYFSTKIYIDGADTWPRWRGGAAQLHMILETDVLWRLLLYLNFGRKIVADFFDSKNRKSWGENRGDAKS
jgi:hypothetical protein